MKKLIIFLIITLSLNAQSLRSLLSSATANNELLKRDNFKLLSAKKGIEAVNRGYFPTIDIGAMAQNSNPRMLMRPGTTYIAFVKLNYIVYDGGTKKYTKKQKIYNLSSINDANKQFKESLYLQIVQEYFNIKSLNGLIKALYFKKNAIKAGYKKVKALRDAGIVGDVELFELKSALESVKFNLNSLKLQKETLLSELSLKVGKKINHINNSHFIKKTVTLEPNYLVKSLRAKVESIKESANVILANNNPKINLSLDHNKYKYNRTDKAHPKGLSNQTTITLNAKIRVFDGGTTTAKAQAVKLQAMSLGYEANYRLKEQKNNFKLANLRIKNIKVQIKSAKSSLIAAQKSYNAILKKYNAGIIDNSEYLNAISNLAQAKANYKKALNDLEVAYAIYYFNAGKNLKGYIK